MDGAFDVAHLPYLKIYKYINISINLIYIYIYIYIRSFYFFNVSIILYAYRLGNIVGPARAKVVERGLEVFQYYNFINTS